MKHQEGAKVPSVEGNSLAGPTIDFSSTQPEFSVERARRDCDGAHAVRFRVFCPLTSARAYSKLILINAPGAVEVAGAASLSNVRELGEGCRLELTRKMEDERAKWLATEDGITFVKELRPRRKRKRTKQQGTLQFKQVIPTHPQPTESERVCNFRLLRRVIPEAEAEAISFYEHARHIAVAARIAQSAQGQDWADFLSQPGSDSLSECEQFDRMRQGSPSKPLRRKINVPLKGDDIAGLCIGELYPWLLNPQWEALVTLPEFPSVDWFSLPDTVKQSLVAALTTVDIASDLGGLPDVAKLRRSGDMERLCSGEVPFIMKGACVARVVVDVNLGLSDEQLSRQLIAHFRGNDGINKHRDAAQRNLRRFRGFPDNTNRTSIAMDHLKDLAAWRLHESKGGWTAAQMLWTDRGLVSRFSSVSGSHGKCAYANQASFIRAAKNAEPRIMELASHLSYPEIQWVPVAS